MADTIRAPLPTEPCSDCGEVGKVYITHWGPLVLPTNVGKFCPSCMKARIDDRDAGRPPRPLGKRFSMK